MTAYIDKKTGCYLVPVETYKNFIYCRVYRLTFSGAVEYTHSAYFRPERIAFNPVKIA